jgi:hypothetical protein
MDTAHAFESDEMSAEFFVGVVVAALAHEVEVELGKHAGKSVRVVEFERITVVSTALNLVAAGSRRAGLTGRPNGLEKAFRAKLDSVGDLGGRKSGAFNDGRYKRNASFRGPWKEKTNCPISIDRMRTQKGERIGVTAGHERVDLGLDARIARAGVFRKRRGGVMLLQDQSLPG